MKAKGMALPPGIEKFLTPVATASISSANISLGQRGNNVKALQEFLISQAKGKVAASLKLSGATGYFGSLTKSALSEFQASVGITPATGAFGPMTKAYLKKLGY